MSCIVFYKGCPYDVGGFIDAHPGGRDIIAQWERLDMTDAYDDIGHSANADQILAQYRIDDHSAAVDASSSSPARRTPTPTRASNGRLRATTRLVCAIVGFTGLGHALYRYYDYHYAIS